MTPTTPKVPASAETDSFDMALLTRREAIKRVTLLLGATLSPALLEGMAYAQTTGVPAAGVSANFTGAQFALVSAIVERILPRTDTPGARDVGVPTFIDVMFGTYMTDVEKKTWTDGLADVEVRSRRAHSRGFVQLTDPQQDAILKAVAIDSQPKEKTFFHQIRDLTIVGYFSSEKVGRDVTGFDPIPGRFNACIPLSEIGNRSWTR